ncbi:MAG: ArnT family glycosyltransferase [Planctomycetota bacterium]
MSASFSVTSERRWLLCLLLLALALRLAAAVVIDSHVRGAGRMFLVEGDANGYWELGRKLASGEDYAIHSPPRYVLRTPGFPLLLAGFMRVVGERVFPITLLLAGIGTLCCGLTWLLARKLAGPRAALAALLLAAVSPLQTGSSVQVLSEGWFSAWLLLSLLGVRPLLRILDHSGASNLGSHESSVRRLPAQGLLAGLAAGVGVLVRPGWILWPGGVAFCLLLAGRGDRKTRGLVFLCVCLGCWLVLFPWAWRNQRICGHWVYTSLWSGPSLYDGLHTGATGASDMRFFDDEQLSRRMSEYAVNEEYKRRAWEFAVSEPGRALELAAVKAGRFLSPALRAEGFSGGLLSLVSGIWYAVLVALVFRGSWIVWRCGCWPKLLLLWLPFLQFLLIHLVFVGSIRYRLPVEFPLLVLAGSGLAGKHEATGND